MIDSARLLERIRHSLAAQNDPGRYGDRAWLFELAWRCENAVHTDCQFQQDLDYSRDRLPALLAGSFVNAKIGDSTSRQFDPGQLPRPGDDKYAGRLKNSDPVYAVCGVRQDQRCRGVMFRGGQP